MAILMIINFIKSINDVVFILQNLIADIVQQINSADELSNLVNKICQQRDSNQNDQLSKDLHDLASRWNSLNLNVINRSNRFGHLLFLEVVNITNIFFGTYY